MTECMHQIDRDHIFVKPVNGRNGAIIPEFHTTTRPILVILCSYGPCGSGAARRRAAAAGRDGPPGRRGAESPPSPPGRPTPGSRSTEESNSNTIHEKKSRAAKDLYSAHCTYTCDWQWPKENVNSELFEGIFRHIHYTGVVEYLVYTLFKEQVRIMTDNNFKDSIRLPALMRFLSKRMCSIGLRACALSDNGKKNEVVI